MPSNKSTQKAKEADAARKARLQGSELSKINMKGMSLAEMQTAIREAKARAAAAYSAGKDVPPKPTSKPPQGKEKQKLNQKLRRSEEKSDRESRLKSARAQIEPKPASKRASKPSSKRASKPTRGTSGVKTSNTAPPSTERFGPGGMMGTVDQPHERRFQWRR